ncbi:MAG: lysophospholipase [Gammaproteobacteria bacterium]|nr:lysophospholipase [Gammaproteobacteria bacterium]
MYLRLVFGLLVPLLLASCANFLFYPVKEPILKKTELERELNIKIRDMNFTSKDGTKLHGWFLPNQKGRSKATVLFCHGNAENITSHIEKVWWLVHYGYNVFMPEYRGYGASEGDPDLEGIHEDIHAAIELMVSDKAMSHRNYLMYGHSLGGAIATATLANSPHRLKFNGLIVEGSFTSYRDAARDALGNFWLTWLFQYPLAWTIPDDIRPVDEIKKISPVPVLIVHGNEDRVISAGHGKALFDAAKKPKQYWIVSGGGHSTFRSEANRTKLLEYLDSLLK